MKKIVSLTLSFIMVAMLLPFNVWALELEEVQKENVATEEPFVENETSEVNNENEMSTLSSSNIVASGYCGGEGDGTNLAWSITDDGVLLISGSGKMADYSYEHTNGVFQTTAPWKDNILKTLIINEGVTSLGNYAFYNCNDLEGDLLIPDSIITIGDSVFTRCTGFTGDLVIPNNVTSIGKCAFDSCSGFTGSLTIPDSVVTIGYAAFYNCSGFTGNLTISENISVIEDATFQDCTGFTGDLIIPESVTDIGSAAFNNCTGFSGNLTFKNRIKTIGEAAFQNCGINNYYFEGNAPVVTAANDYYYHSFDAEDIIYYLIENNTWLTENGKWNGYNVKTYEDVIDKGYCGGEGDGTNLTWLLTDNGVLTISGSGKMANYNIPTETSLNEAIADAPWVKYVDFITKIVFDDEITTIGNEAFINFKNIISINLPNNLTKIGVDAFYGCEKLCGNLVIPDSVTKIDSLAFWGTSISCLELGESVKEIGFFAFGACEELEYVYFNEALTTIGNWAFLYCKNIKNDIIFYENIKNIGRAAFVDCSGVEAFYFKGNAPIVTAADEEQPTFNIDVTLYYLEGTSGWEVDENEKWNGYNLTAFIANEEVKFDQNAYIVSGYCGADPFGGKNMAWALDGNGTLFIKGKGNMENFSILSVPWKDYTEQIKGIVFEDGITSIGDCAFNYINNITTELIIPDSVTKIGKSSFGGCIKIKEIYFEGAAPEVIPSDGYGPSFPNSVTIYYKEGKMGWVSPTWNGYVAKVYGKEIAAGHCGAEDDGNNIRWTLYSEGKLVISGQGKMANYISGITTSAPWGEYVNDIKKLVVEDGVTTIGNNAFYKCENISSSITLPDSIETIGDFAFWGCEKLKGDLIIPGCVKSIGSYAFGWCGFDGKLIISDSVEVIGEAAFFCCYKLTGDLIIPSKIEDIPTLAFYNCTGFNGKLVIPEGVKSIGKTSFCFCSYFTDRIVIPKSVTNIGTQAFLGSKKIYFLGNAPSVANASDNYSSFDEDITLYYVSSKSGWTSPTWNGYNTATWNPYVDGEMSNSKEGFYIKDAKLGIPVNNAQLYYDDKVLSSDENGYIAVPDDITDFEINAHGYTTRRFENFKRSSTGIDIITLSPNLNAIIKAELNYNGTKYDLLSEHKTVNIKNKDTSITITCYASGENVAGYALYQRDENKVVTFIEDTDGFFEIKLKDLEQNCDVYIMTWDNDKKKLAETRIGLNVVLEESFAPSSVSLGKDVSFTIAEDIPLFGGQELTVNMPILPCTFELTDEKVKIGINFDVFEWEKDSLGGAGKLFGGFTTLNDADLARAIDDFCLGVNSPLLSTVESPIVDMNLKVVGYAEGNLDGSCIEGKIYLKFEISGGKEFPFMAGPVPLVVEIGITGELSAGGELKITPTTVEYYINAEAAAELELYLGVGFKGFSAGVYGNGKIKFEFLFAGSGESESGLYGITLEANVGVKVKILGRDLGNFALISGGPWELYSRDIDYDEKGQASNHSATSYINTFNKNENSFENTVSSILISDKTYPVIDITEAENTDTIHFDDEDEAFQYIGESVYTGIQHKLVSVNGVLMEIYTDADVSRDAADASCLVYSIYDEYTETWSTPQMIDNDGTADFSPEVYSDETCIYVIWQDAEEQINDNWTLNEIGAKTALSIAKYDTETNGWVNIGTIQSNNGAYEAFPQIIVHNDIVTVAWANNSENDVFGINGTNTLYYCLYNGEIWSDNKEIISVASPVTNLVLGVLNESSVVAYTVDTDGNLVTFDDSVSYAYAIDIKETVEIGCGATDVQFASIAGNDSMVWCENSIIYAKENIVDEKNIVTSNANIIDGSFKICESENGGAIIYSAYSEGKTNIEAVIYDSVIKEWGMPIQLTNQSAYMECLEALYHGENLVITSVQRFVEQNNENHNEICNLICLTKSYDGKAIITSVVHKNDESIVPGKETTIVVAVTNNGTAFVKEMNFRVQNSNEEVLFNKTITLDLKPGETKDVEINFVLPDIAKKDTYTVFCDNNSCDVVIGFADIKLFVSEYALADKNYLSLKIENVGFEKISGITIINSYTDDTINYLTNDFDEIGYGESVTAILEILPEMFADENSLPISIKINTNGNINANSDIEKNITLYKQTQERLLESIKVNIDSAKLEYSVFDTELNTDGIVVIAYYSDGTEVDVTDACSFSGYDNTVGEKKIYVTYSEGTIIVAETEYTVTVSEASTIFGDVNGDKKINVVDANFVRRYAAKLVEFDTSQLAAADVNGDKKINVVDANLIRRYAAKLIISFPVEG